MKTLWIIPLIIAMSGCSAQHFAGEEADQHGCTLKKDLWGNVYIKMTGDGECSIEKIDIQKSDKNYAIYVGNVKVSQRVTEVTQASVAKLEAIAKVQDEQVKYIGQIAGCMAQVAEAVSSSFGNPFSVAAKYIGKAVVAKYTTTQATTQPSTQTTE